MPTDEGDFLGIGGASTLSSHDGNVLRYVPDIEGAYLRNVSPVPLEVTVHGEFPEVTKSGFGRPTMRVTSYLTSGTEATYNKQANVPGGTNGKGFTFDISTILQPGGHIRFIWVDLDTPGPPPAIDISASDDYGGLGAVEPVTQREVTDSPDENVVTDKTLIPIYPGPVDKVYTTLAWASPASATDQIGLNRTTTLLPPGITYSNSVLKNVSNTYFNSVYVNTFLGGTSFTNYGYTSNASGDFGGVSSGRMMATIGFAVGAVITFTGPGTNNTVVGNISFCTKSIVSRHSDLVV